MKPLACLLFIALSAPRLAWSAEAVASDQPQFFHFKNTPASQVLEVYRAVLGTNGQRIEFVTSQPARVILSTRPFNLDTNFSGPAAETARMLARALAEQTGVVVTPLDDRRVSVTFNEVIQTPKPTAPTPEERAAIFTPRFKPPPSVRVGADTLTVIINDPPDPKVETTIRWTDITGYSVSAGDLVLTLTDGSKQDLPRRSAVSLTSPELLAPILESKGVPKR